MVLDARGLHLVAFSQLQHEARQAWRTACEGAAQSFAGLAISLQVSYRNQSLSSALAVSVGILTVKLCTPSVTSLPPKLLSCLLEHLASLQHAVKSTRKYATLTPQAADRFLQAVPLLRTMGTQQRHALAAQLEAQHYHDGEVVVAEGEQAEAMYFVASGEVSVHIEGVARLVHRHAVGDYFGERGLLYNELRAATVTANGETVCLKLRRVGFEVVKSMAEDELLQRQRTFEQAGWDQDNAMSPARRSHAAQYHAPRQRYLGRVHMELDLSGLGLDVECATMLTASDRKLSLLRLTADHNQYDSSGA